MGANSKYEFEFQLIDALTGASIYPGGYFYVVAEGAASKEAITDTDDVAITQPGTVSSGNVSFRSTSETVDVYGFTDTGYPFVLKSVKAGARLEVRIDRSRLDNILFIPFDVTDSDVSASAENLTGIYLPNDLQVLSNGLGVTVITADAGTTIDVGTDGSGVNDPDGFIDGLDIAAAGPQDASIGYTVGTNNVWLDLTGGDVEWSIGALLHPATTKQAKAEGADAAGTDGNGIYILTPHTATNTGSSDQEQLSYTLAGSPTTIAGLIRIPTRLGAPA